MLGSLMLCLKGMRRMMFQLSGFYYKGFYKGSIRVPLKGSCKGFYKGSLRVPSKGSKKRGASTISTQQEARLQACRLWVSGLGLRAEDLGFWVIRV